jgi:hypothetical protein
VLNRVFGEMYNLKAIAGLLVQLPLKSDPKERAGPPFELPYTLNFPTHETDFWRLHLDLVEAAATQLPSICRQTSGPGLAYAEALRMADRHAAAEIETNLNASSATARYLRSMGDMR